MKSKAPIARMMEIINYHLPNRNELDNISLACAIEASILASEVAKERGKAIAELKKWVKIACINCFDERRLLWKLKKMGGGG